VGWSVGCALALLALATLPARAQSGATLLTQGNERFQAKAYDQAAEFYRQAQAAKNAPAAAALYNEGCALLEQNKPADAASRFRDADAKAGDDLDLSARARFNLGQALFKQAEPQKDQQPDQALDLLKQSAAAYRSVLDVNPTDAEAARNVEIARRLMKQIEDKKREQQQQQQNQDQKNQDQKNQKQNQKGGGQGQSQDQQDQQGGQQQEQQRQADNLKDLAKRQRQAADESAKAQQNTSDQQSSEQRQKQQQSIKDDTAKAQKEQQQSGSSDQLKKAQEEQSKALDELKKQNAEGAKQHQEEAAKALEQAAKDAQAKAEQAKQQKAQQEAKQDKDGKDQQAQQQANADSSKDQNYDKTAAALLDRERKLHQQRQPVIRAQRGTAGPVEKDW
jgi:hypothetical protein